MAKIDLSKVSVTEANEALRRHGADREDVEILNPDAKHHIGVGLVDPITVRVHGSAGYFCAGLTDGPRFEVDNNVGWGAGDNMLGGSLVVRGNAGAIAGVAIRGAEIVVHGNIGSRAGQVMKAGTLCCAGNANFMAGYMMYGGRLIILGNSGEKVGQDMTGGTIYVGGKVQSLGTDATLIDLPGEEADEIRAFLDRYGIAAKVTLQKVVNAGKKLRYPRTEPRVRVIPFFLASGDNGYWNAKVQEDIHVKAQIGRYRIRGYGAARAFPHISDLAFKRDLTNLPPDPHVVDKVDLRTTIGGRSGARPLELSMPIMIAPMSYGALSKSAKLSLAIASRLSDTSENTGEGGMTNEQRAEAKRLIYQCLAGRLGWNIHDMRRADALEIYISQGAKPGLGGQLMAKKVTAEIARIRGIPAGIDLRSPSRHPDVLGADDLVIKVEEFREATSYRIPISVKLGAGRVRDDIKIAFKDGFDFVELDGMQGSTGAAGHEVLEYVGIPTLSAIQEAKDALSEVKGGDEMSIVLMGGIKDGVDAAKAIALGARAIAVGTSAIIAGGCIACLQCHVGQCVVGIATQDPVHEKRYNIPVEAQNIHRFLECLRWQVASVTHALGYKNVHDLSRDDLVALTPEAARITRLPYVPGYRERPQALLRQA
jgi:glutamate synthase domain-containing protein 2